MNETAEERQRRVMLLEARELIISALSLVDATDCHVLAASLKQCRRLCNDEFVVSVLAALNPADQRVDVNGQVFGSPLLVPLWPRVFSIGPHRDRSAVNALS